MACGRFPGTLQRRNPFLDASLPSPIRIGGPRSTPVVIRDLPPPPAKHPHRLRDGNKSSPLRPTRSQILVADRFKNERSSPELAPP